jgi:putative ABC transport system ATP-binding protein
MLVASEAGVAVVITVSKIATKNQERFVKESILEVQNITKEVNSPEGVLTILKDVNLTINSGDVTSIVGPSGSGKTTLLAIMAGLDLPSRGRIKLMGHEITTMNEDKRAQVRSNDVGFVFQSFHLLPRLSALDNVMLPLEILGDKNAKKKSLEALDQMGLEKRVRHLPNQLSGGEKQRVAIARAMVKQPKILFADEPTGNLDKTSTEVISDLLFSINRSSQTTIVIVTHDLLLAQNCETMHELNEGSLKC